jgi:hypothetical protein
MMQAEEDAAGRRARHRDVMISAVVAAVALIAMNLATGERRLGPILAVAVLTGGVTGAVLSARRAGWRWDTARWELLGAGVVAAFVYWIGWLVGR